MISSGLLHGLVKRVLDFVITRCQELVVVAYESTTPTRSLLRRENYHRGSALSHKAEDIENASR